MLVKEYGTSIENAIDAGNEEVANGLVWEALRHYARVINDAFPIIPEKDIPFILTDLKLFYDSILDSRTQEEREVLTEAVQLLTETTHVHVHTATCKTKGPLTETAARELYEERKRQEGIR